MKKIKLLITLLIISVLTVLISCKKDKDLPFKERIRYIDDLFENSKVAEVANDVNSDNYDAVKFFFKENPNIAADTKSQYAGYTLLQMASVKHKYQAAKALLESGADPNLEEVERGGGIGFSSFTYILLSRDSTLMKLYIKHGADVNMVSRSKSTPYRTPLITACRQDLNSVKFLVKYGADPRAVYNKYESPLNAALQSGSILIVNYLIFDLKVDYKKPYFYDESIAWKLRDMTYPINSEKHLQKMKLVKFLKENGIDYYAEPIPERFHKEFDEDFLSKY